MSRIQLEGADMVCQHSRELWFIVCLSENLCTYIRTSVSHAEDSIIPILHVSITHTPILYTVASWHHTILASILLLPGTATLPPPYTLPPPHTSPPPGLLQGCPEALQCPIHWSSHGCQEEVAPSNEQLLSEEAHQERHRGPDSHSLLLLPFFLLFFVLSGPERGRERWD